MIIRVNSWAMIVLIFVFYTADMESGLFEDRGFNPFSFIINAHTVNLVVIDNSRTPKRLNVDF